MKYLEIRTTDPTSKLGYTTSTTDNGDIPYIRCTKCKQHLSLFGSRISMGVIAGVIDCLNCKTMNRNITINSKYNKKLRETYLEKNDITNA